MAHKLINVTAKLAVIGVTGVLAFSAATRAMAQPYAARDYYSYYNGSGYYPGYAYDAVGQNIALRHSRRHRASTVKRPYLDYYAQAPYGPPVTDVFRNF
jgi:hypothetical protein